jgi:hypothetical protein
MVAVKRLAPLHMNRCAYCGKDNDDTSMTCVGCGTPLTVAAPTPSDNGARGLRTPLELSLLTALGLLLTSAALFFAVGRAAVEIGLLPGKVPAGYPGMYSFLTSAFPAPFIVLGAIFPTFTLCRTWCQGRSHALTTASLTLLALAVLALLPKVLPSTVSLWCVPAVMLGRGGNWSGGYYAGTALQFAAGAWLLIWFRPRKNSDEPAAA